MASKPLSNDEAKNLMKQLGMTEASARDEDRVAKGGSSTSEASVAQLLSELYRPTPVEACRPVDLGGAVARRTSGNLPLTASLMLALRALPFSSIWCIMDAEAVRVADGES